MTTAVLVVPELALGSRCLIPHVALNVAFFHAGSRGDFGGGDYLDNYGG